MMTLNKFVSGVNTSFSTELNNNQSESNLLTLKNHARSLIDRTGVYSTDGTDLWGEAYSDSNGRNNSVNIGSTSAEFDTNKYKANYLSSTEPFVIIEATSLSAQWTSNDCLTKEFSSGKWLLYCTTGTDEVKRAQIHKSLWYGTDGTDSLVLDFTNVTALKTNVTRDVGKRAFYSSGEAVRTGNGTSYSYSDYTFANTTTNDDCSCWSYISGSASYTSDYDLRFQMPIGTDINSRSDNDVYSNDEIGTDRTVDENDNPATARIYAKVNRDSYSVSAYIKGIILANSSATISENTNGTGTAINNIDFFTDHSIPLLTAGTLDNFENIITHNIPSGTFSTTVSKAILGTILPEYETGANVQFKLTSTANDSGWLEADDVIQTFTAFTAEPDKLIIKLIPKSSSPTTGYPSIRAFGVRAT